VLHWAVLDAEGDVVAAGEEERFALLAGEEELARAGAEAEGLRDHVDRLSCPGA
jgi:hypothetical protein